MLRSRRRAGQAIVEAALALTLITTAVIGGTYLLMNVGAALYGQEQMGLLATGAAIVAAVNDDGSPSHAAAQTAAQNWLTGAAGAINIQSPALQPLVLISPGGVNSFKVTVTGSAPLLFGVFGRTVPLTATSVVPIAIGQASMKYDHINEISGVGAGMPNQFWPVFSNPASMPHSTLYPAGTGIPAFNMTTAGPNPGSCGCAGGQLNSLPAFASFPNP